MVEELEDVPGVDEGSAVCVARDWDEGVEVEEDVGLLVKEEVKLVGLDVGLDVELVIKAAAMAISGVLFKMSSYCQYLPAVFGISLNNVAVQIPHA